MRRPAKSMVLIMVTLLLIASVLWAAPAKEAKTLSPFWTLDINGNEVTHKIFASSKLTLVNVWATYCPPCLKELPDLGELSKEYDPSLVQIVGIVSDVYHPNQKILEENLRIANDIIKAAKADYLHLLPSEDLFNLRLKDVQFVPETFFVDSKGNIVGEKYISMRSKEEWKKIIDSNLALLK
jgi:thiol-disulfide isomerase/thioredoxin